MVGNVICDNFIYGENGEFDVVVVFVVVKGVEVVIVVFLGKFGVYVEVKDLEVVCFWIDEEVLCGDVVVDDIEFKIEVVDGLKMLVIVMENEVGGYIVMSCFRCFSLKI